MGAGAEKANWEWTMRSARNIYDGLARVEFWLGVEAQTGDQN